MDVNDDNFQENVIEKSKEILVVVDFWAPWCAPCNMLAPVLDKVVESYEGKVVLAKVNIDENSKTADEYKVDAIPAIKMFKNGEVVAEFTGVQSEETIKEHINKALE